jgi:outer membrane protein OmpA-like peptidoglycan-associated protein
MKKEFLLVLLLSIVLPSCKKKKIDVKGPGTVVQTVSRPNGNETYSEDTGEFALEDDAEFNVFEDDQKKQVEVAQDLGWNEVDAQELDKIQFDYDKSEIRPTERQKIESNAKAIKKKLAASPDAKVAVKGHSCKIAKNKEYNYTLSQERAQTIAREYQDQGIAAENLKPVGYGASMLLTEEEGMEAQAPNRRVETVIS